MDPLFLVRCLNAGATILGGLFLAFALVYGRLSAISRRRLFSEQPRPLTAQEFLKLQLWQRRTIGGFLLTLGALGAYAFSFLFAQWLPSWLYLAGSIAVLVLAIASLSIHFSAHCPVCLRRIGFQSTLLLPRACEICGAELRPTPGAAPLGPALPRRIHVVSPIRVFGWPLFAVALGGDPDSGGKLGVARAVVAVGDLAIGAVAVGSVAIGILPVGGVSIGIFGVGGVAIGLAAVGGLSAGAFALGGFAFGIYAMGGVALGPHAWSPGILGFVWTSGR